MGPDGVAIARAVTSGTTCPSLDSDGNTSPMNVRVGPSSNGNFPNLVCEAAVNPKTKYQIGGQTLPVASNHPQKIIVIGDTGCRIKVTEKAKPKTMAQSRGETSGGKLASPTKAGMKVKSKIQDCSDLENGWPFAKLAKLAAAQNPDLVIHVGDYHYRESACPPGNAKCADSAYGDNWTSWSQDFFSQANSLLAAAPWVFVRGNHEICARAQEGYFRYLDPRPSQLTCENVIPPYLIPFKNLSLAVMDSSAEDITNRDFESVGALQARGAWLVTHRPPWPSVEAKKKGDGDVDEEGEVNTVTQLVGVPENLGLVLTGHQHVFRATTFHDGRPPQVIAGNGGTMLEKNPAPEAPGTPVDGTTLDSVTTLTDFGFVLLTETAPSTWSAEVYGLNGNPVVTCHLAGDANGLMKLDCK